MQRSLSVFNTDLINRQKMLIPASELVSAEFKHRQRCHKYSLPVGLPVHIQHDMHRFAGWSEPLGIYFDGQLVRSLGVIEEADSDQEKEMLARKAEAYWEDHHTAGAEPFKSDIIARAAPADLSDAKFMRMEAAVAKRSGIASELYPHLFACSTAYVDKDGLVEYSYILDNLELIQLGVFRERGRDLLIFAHRFFRRSLSHRNKLNSYFLQSADATAKGDRNLRARLRLDPDIIGHPASSRHLIELEYWRGPLYNDDIAHIPNGVAEHKADQATRHYEGIDRTQFWWKAPESRSDVGGQSLSYRTFEAEELIEDPSGGLPDEKFGCRYVHSEFSADEANITHFDGAIRAYDGTQYLDRFDASIDRAGKRAAYTKLFRFDGALGISYWKRLLSDFFRGNALIPEYLGAPAETNDGTVDGPASVESQSCVESDLAALISMTAGDIGNSNQIIAEHSQQIGNLIVPFVEIGTGEVARYIRAHFNLNEAMAVGVLDKKLNLSRICIANSEDRKLSFEKITAALSDALCADASSGLVTRASIPLCWDENGLIITLSFVGDAAKVAAALRELPAAVDPSKSASDWAEPFKQLIKAISSAWSSEVHWAGVERGQLSITRTGTVQQQMLLSDALKNDLVAEGVLSADEAMKIVAFDADQQRGGS